MKTNITIEKCSSGYMVCIDGIVLAVFKSLKAATKYAEKL
jgi:hypothetical protein